MCSISNFNGIYAYCCYDDNRTHLIRIKNIYAYINEDIYCKIFNTIELIYVKNGSLQYNWSSR